jgi:ketosteroid isomerase-like protein
VSTAEENIKVVQAMFQGFAARDVEAVIRHIDPECEFFPAGTALLTGRSDPYRGHDGIRAYFADVAAGWDELTIELSDFRAVADSVVVVGRVKGHSATADADAEVVWAWTLRDGLVIDGRVFPTSGEAVRWLDRAV